jgi:hypothetical protein
MALMKSSSPFKRKTKLLALCVGSVCFYGKYSMELIFSTEMIKLNDRKCNVSWETSF